MHEGKLLKQLIEDRKLKKKEAAAKLGVSPQLLQGYFRSERLQSSTKNEIRQRLGLIIESSNPPHVNEPNEEYAIQKVLIESLQQEIVYLKEMLRYQSARVDEKDEMIKLLNEQLRSRTKK